jgi:hypothetical protein
MGISIAPGVAYGFPFVPIVSPGNGRARDYSFPEPGFLVPNLTQQVSGQRQGNGGEGGPTFARTVYTADPGTPTGPVALNGVSMIAIVSGAAAGQAYSFGGSLFPRLSPSLITADDQAFTRVIWNMCAGNAPGAANTDFGGYIVQPGSSTPDMRLMSGGILGFGFQISALGVGGINLVIRGPNGLITLNLPTLDSSILHALEMLILPGTRTNYAQLQAFADGVPIVLPALSSSWAPGTNLPPLAIVGNRLGFSPGVINNCLAGANLLLNATAGLRVMTAPTLQDLY